MLSLFLCFSLSAAQARRPKLVQTVAPVNAVGCDLCTTIVKVVEDALKDAKTEQEVAQIVSQYCTVLGTQLKPLCETIATRYVPIIMQFLDDKLEKIEICQKLGFCEEAVVSYMPQSVALTAGACDMCTTVVTFIEKLLKDGKVESEIATAIASLCSALPSPVSSLCSVIVERYIPTIIQWIESGMEKADICTKLGFCSNAIIQAQNGLNCQMCKLIVAQVERCLLDKKVESEVTEYLEGLCTKYFPDPYASICTSFVANYTATIMQLLEQGVSQFGVCEKLDYCSTKAVSARLPLRDGLACKVCTTIVAAVEKIMVSTKVESEVISLVQQLCQKFPAPYSTLCDSLVQQFVPQIMQWLEQGLEKTEICTRLNICSASTHRFMGARLPATLGSDDPTCDMCKDFIDFAVKELKTVSVDTLWFLVNTECPRIPYLKYFCEIINEDNIVTLVNLILSGVDSLKACEWLDLCF